MADDRLTHDTHHLGSLFALSLADVGEIARFTGCSGLSWSTAVVEVKTARFGKAGIVTEKRPGRMTFEDIVLKRGLSSDKALTDWYENVMKGDVKRTDGSIIVYDTDGKEVDRFNFFNGWPSKWDASDLSADSDDVVIETLTITHERLERAKK